MKRLFSLLISTFCMFMILGTSGCAAQTTYDNSNTIVLQVGNPKMIVNGTEKDIDSDIKTVPVVQNDRTLVPIRAIIEEMGGSVSWNNEKQEVTLNYGSDEIKLTIDKNTAYLNNSQQILDTAPTIINGRTMLPIRFIAEGFKFNVEWNEKEQKITISKGVSLNSEIATASDDNNNKVLVLYFSCTGNTKTLAEKIYEETGGDIEEIIPLQAYSAEDLNYNNDECRANSEIKSDARPEIKDLTFDIKEYDKILIGYPIWWGNCPPVIKTFLEKYDFCDKTIMPFCTSGSSSINSSVSTIKELTRANVTEGFRGTSSTSSEQISAWLTENGFKK